MSKSKRISDITIRFSKMGAEWNLCDNGDTGAASPRRVEWVKVFRPEEL
jgi:hypothetical protein